MSGALYHSLQGGHGNSFLANLVGTVVLYQNLRDLGWAMQKYRGILRWAVGLL